MRYILFFILLFFIVSAKSFAETPGSRPVVKISSAIEVSYKEKYSLLDLVELQGASDETFQILKKIQLEALNSSGTVQISQKKWIELFKKNNLTHLQLVIPESTTLQQKTTFSEIEFYRKLKNQLGLICSNCEFEVQASSKIQMNSLKTKSSSQLSIDLNSVTRLQSSMLVKIGMDDQTAWVPVQVKAMSPVLVAKRNLLNVSSLSVDDYHLQVRDIASLTSAPISAEKLSQMSLTQSVSQGTVLTESLFRKTLVIKKGQLVKVLVNENDFQIAVQASAEESGAIGDSIKIKTVGTNKLLSAVIQADQSVLVK